MSEPRCKHRHTAATHPGCFKKPEEKKPANWWDGKRIGFLDIEATGLKANFGFMLSWAIKERNGPTKSDVITSDEMMSRVFDKRITKSLLDEILKYDVVVTYYGTGFDIPFIRSRAFKHNIPFIPLGKVSHWDLYYQVRNKLKLSRSSLEVATKFLGIQGKNHVEEGVWLLATYGDTKSLGYVLDHNVRDVVILEKLYERFEGQVKWNKRSV